MILATVLALLISISAFSSQQPARVEAKPLNQNQVRFRRLPPKEFSAAIGSSITIECEAGGSPPPSMHWLKNGVRIIQNDLDENQLEAGQLVQVDEVNQIGLSSTRTRLFIDCADYQDEAVYSCVAENAFTRISAHTKLNLIRPLQAAASAASAANLDNDLLEEPQMDLAQAESKQPQLDGGALEAGKSLSAVAQCLSQRAVAASRPIEPLRIHMWTHNIVEVMRNSVILYCRSNANKRQSNINQDMTTTTTASTLTDLIKTPSASSSSAASTSWTLPDDKLVGSDQKDKYEILETGDLLVKDLRWADMGSYVCTVSDEQSSDSVSIFVYPASVKGHAKRSAAQAPRFT